MTHSTSKKLKTKKLKATPYHDISSILELDKADVQVQLQRPTFGKEMLSPHRGSYYCVLLLTKGAVNHMANLQYFHAEENALIFSSPGMIKCWDEPSVDVEGYSLLFTADFFKTNGHSTTNLSQFPFFQWDARHFFQTSKKTRKNLEPLFKKILHELEGKKLKNDSVIQSYINILLIELERVYSEIINKEDRLVPRHVKLANEYKCLVSHHFHKNLSVKEYAEMLNVTPNHLNDTVKATIGKTASSLIQEMTLLEAKVLLRQTQISIAEVAFHLNFEDPSYFGRFFKKLTGMTPFQYRKNNLGNP